MVFPYVGGYVIVVNAVDMHLENQLFYTLWNLVYLQIKHIDCKLR